MSKKSFLEGVGRDTLLGRLSSWLQSQRISSLSSPWVGASDVMNQRVHLPGALGRNVSSSTQSLLVSGMASLGIHDRGAGRTGTIGGSSSQSRQGRTFDA